MTAQVVYLNLWLDCGDDELRRNHQMQTKIEQAKAKFWYDMNVHGINDYQKFLCYSRWINKNRDKLHVITSEG